MTLETKTIGSAFNTKAKAVKNLALAALLSASLLTPFNAKAGDTDKTAPQQIEKAAAETVSPSYFEPDKDGVLWFRQGTDDRGPYVMSLQRSTQKANIVILIATNEATKDKALTHGKALQAWLTAHPSGPTADGKVVELAIAVERESGTAYYFNVVNMPYWNDELGIKDHPHAFGPKAAGSVLLDVIADYIAAKELKAEKEASEQASAHGSTLNSLAVSAPSP